MSSYSLVLDVTALGDVLMRDRFRHDGSLVGDVLVSGSVLRGALAESWLRRPEGRPDDLFQELFTQGSLAFLGGSPIEEPPWGGPPVPLLPAPITLHVPKDGDSSEAAAVDAASTPASDLGGWRRHRGLVGVDTGDEPRGWVSDESFRLTRSRIGTVLDGSGMAAKEPNAGKLFSETLVAAGTRFRLQIAGDEPALAEIMTLFDDPAIERRLSLGRSRTVRGMCSIDQVEIVPTVPPNTLLSSDRHVLWFTTDAVLLDVHHRSHGPDAAWLASVAGTPEGVFKVVDAQIRWDVVMGWSGIHRGPKPLERVVSRGSVVVFECGAEALRSLAVGLRGGIGWRRIEGFGQVELDHPVHRAAWPVEEASVSGVTLRQEIAESAQRIAQELAGEEFDHSDWAPLSAAAVDPELRVVRPDPPEGRNPQARAGRGRGVGQHGREARRTALRLFDDHAKTLEPIDRWVLADDVERELRLLAKLRDRRRRQLR